MPSAWHSCTFVSLVSPQKKKRETCFIYFCAFRQRSVQIVLTCRQRCWKTFPAALSFLWEEHPIIDTEHPERLWCVQLHNDRQPGWEEQENTTKKTISFFLFLKREKHLWSSSRMDEPSAYIVTPGALATWFALSHHCQAHSHPIEMDFRRGARLKWSICRGSPPLLVRGTCLGFSAGLYLDIPIHLNFIHGNSVSR